MCKRKEKKPASKVRKAISAIIGIVLVLIIVVIAMPDETTANSKATSSGKADKSTSATVNDKKAVYEDDKVKVTFLKIFEEDYLKDTCFLQLKVENKTASTVWVAIDEAYANDSEIKVGSGTPMTLAPGKNSSQPFFFTYEVAGITNVDEIKKLDFKIVMYDDNTNQLINTTKSITVNV